MGLTTFRKILLAGLLLLSCLLSRAQDNKDSAWYYANNLTDYATADLVCLVRVGDTKILDTIGGYTIQEVSFEPIKFYKGKTDTKKFRAWLENHATVWKPGTVQGFYLLKGDQATIDKKDHKGEMYYWLENAGFKITDTPFIARMADKDHFKKMVSEYILPDLAGSWASVKFLELIGEEEADHGAMEAKLRLEDEVPSLNLLKGQVITVNIWKDPYLKKTTFISRLQQRIVWEVILYQEEGQLNMKTEFMWAR